MREDIERLVWRAVVLNRLLRGKSSCVCIKHIILMGAVRSMRIILMKNSTNLFPSRHTQQENEMWESPCKRDYFNKIMLRIRVRLSVKKHIKTISSQSATLNTLFISLSHSLLQRQWWWKWLWWWVLISTRSYVTKIFSHSSSEPSVNQ